MGAVTLRDDTLPERLYNTYRGQRRRLGTWVASRLTSTTSAVPDSVLSRVPLPFEVMLYFSDAPVNLYQIRQWLYPLELLNEKHPVFILTRDTKTFRILAREASLPIVNARRIATLDAITASSNIKLAFYVNQNTRNFQAIRYPHMLHAFLSHGESEKSSYMANNQAKAYDFTFVAGDAAVNRIKEQLINFDWESRLLKIGRPQLDLPLRVPPARTPGRTTVLYAPTWEGDRPSMSYGSVQSHGHAIVRQLLDSGRHRLIYRPHPRTGINDPHARLVDRQLRAMIEEARGAEPQAEHRVDLAPDFGPQMTEADVMVADVSAVALDFLPTGKPLIVTVPASPDAPFDRTTFLDSVYELPVSRMPNFLEHLDAWCADDTRRAERSRWVEHYFGDTTPGASMKRFLDACDHVISMRDRLMQQRLDLVEVSTTVEEDAVERAAGSAAAPARLSLGPRQH